MGTRVPPPEISPVVRFGLPGLDEQVILASRRKGPVQAQINDHGDAALQRLFVM